MERSKEQIQNDQRTGGSVPRLERLRGHFPIFVVNGHRYSAMRWLYFQLYDDRDEFTYDVHERAALYNTKRWALTNPNKNRKKNPVSRKKIKEDGDYIELEDLTPNQFPSWLCVHQEYLRLQWWSHDWRETITSVGIARVGRSQAYRPWNQMFFYDKDRYPRFASPGVPFFFPGMESLTRAIRQRGKRTYYMNPGTFGKKDLSGGTLPMEVYTHIPLEFPEIVGTSNRIDLFRMYVKAALEGDKSFDTHMKKIHGRPPRLREMYERSSVQPHWADWQRTMGIEETSPRMMVYQSNRAACNELFRRTAEQTEEELDA